MASCGCAIHRRPDQGEPGRRSFPDRRSRNGYGVGRGDVGCGRCGSVPPVARSRRRWRALREDARQTVLRYSCHVGRATRASHPERRGAAAVMPAPRHLCIETY